MKDKLFKFFFRKEWLMIKNIEERDEVFILSIPKNMTAHLSNVTVTWIESGEQFTSSTEVEDEG